MQRATLVGQEATEWCAGLPLSEVRPLSDSELAALRSEARKLRWMGVLALILPPMAIALVWLVASLPLNESFTGGLLVLSVFPLAVTLTPSPILGNRYLRRGSACARDARAGCLKRFEGRMGAGMLIDAALTQNHILRADVNQQQWLEMLPGSRRVWRAAP